MSILHLHRSQILIDNVLPYFYSVYDFPHFILVDKCDLAENQIAAQPNTDTDSGVYFAAVGVAVRKRKALFFLSAYIKMKKLYVDGSFTVCISMFPGAAPFLNVRQASKPTHWLLGAVLLFASSG